MVHDELGFCSSSDNALPTFDTTQRYLFIYTCQLCTLANVFQCMCLVGTFRQHTIILGNDVFNHWMQWNDYGCVSFMGMHYIVLLMMFAPDKSFQSPKRSPVQHATTNKSLVISICSRGFICSLTASSSKLMA